MPNTKSAIRRTKITRSKSAINRARRSKYRSAVKKMMGFINSGKSEEAKKFFPKFHSQLMKVAKTGTINKKTASRKISRISKKIKNLKK